MLVSGDEDPRRTQAENTTSSQELNLTRPHHSITLVSDGQKGIALSYNTITWQLQHNNTPLNKLHYEVSLHQKMLQNTTACYQFTWLNVKYWALFLLKAF